MVFLHFFLAASNLNIRKCLTGMTWSFYSMCSNWCPNLTALCREEDKLLQNTNALIWPIILHYHLQSFEHIWPSVDYINYGWNLSSKSMTEMLPLYFTSWMIPYWVLICMWSYWYAVSNKIPFLFLNTLNNCASLKSP